MIVDDEPLEREVLRLFVEESGLEIGEILECANGHEAIRTGLLRRPEIILMDINMPGMGGLDVLDKLRVSDRRMKVVISSAYDYFEYARKAMQLEVLDFLVKPVNKAVLLSALRKAVDELDAELSAEQQLSRMNAMVETMGRRIAAELAEGTDSGEAAYYLETAGVGPRFVGTAFHLRPGTDGRDCADWAKDFKDLLSFIDLAAIYSCRDASVDLIVFSKAGGEGAERFDRAEEAILGALRTAAADFSFGRGTEFTELEGVKASCLAARKAAGAAEARSEAEDSGRAPLPEIARIKDFIERNYASKIGLDDIAGAVSCSKYHLCRLFKQGTGGTIVDYLIARRIERAKELLKDEALSVKRISGMVGYSDPNYFTWTFKKAEGVSPIRWRTDGGRGL